MPRQINAAGLALIKRNEGLRLTSYQDIAGIWTIGVGHTPASPGQTITEEEADKLLLNDLNFASAIVVDSTNAVHTTDNQFSAMVSLAFNIGIGGFRTSTVVKRHLAGDYQGAADAFLMWDKAHVDGVLTVVDGLRRRRGEERALYLTPTEEPIVLPEAIDAAIEALKGAQRILARLGYYKGAIDGIWGRLSREALDAYRKERP